MEYRVGAAKSPSGIEGDTYMSDEQAVVAPHRRGCKMTLDLMRAKVLRELSCTLEQSLPTNRYSDCRHIPG